MSQIPNVWVLGQLFLAVSFGYMIHTWDRKRRHYIGGAILFGILGICAVSIGMMALAPFLPFGVNARDYVIASGWFSMMIGALMSVPVAGYGLGMAAGAMGLK
jgi:hypothetical protein